MRRAPLPQILESPIPAFLIKEIREALPAMVFFAIGFNLIVLTTQLILDDYGAQLAGFMIIHKYVTTHFTWHRFDAIQDPPGIGLCRGSLWNPYHGDRVSVSKPYMAAR